MNFLTRAMVPALLIGGTLLAAGGAYAQAKPVCGLNNGNLHGGADSHRRGGRKTGPDDFSASARPRRISSASTPTAAFTGGRSTTRS